MRKFAVCLACVFSLFQLRAQVKENKNLRALLLSERKDTAFINSLIQEAYTLWAVNPDSAFILANRALTLSQHTSYTNGEINALARMSSALGSIGNYALALQHSLEALRLSEKINDPATIAKSLSAVAQTYHYLGDNARAKRYLFQIKKLWETAHDDPALASTLINIGLVFREIKQLDSARTYINQALELALRLNDSGKIGGVYLNLGAINNEMRQFDLAKNYYRLSRSYFNETNHYFLSGVYDGLSVAFDSTGRLDSAFHYAKLSLAHAKALGSPDALLYSVKHVVTLFKKTRQADSALFYQDVVVELSDSLSAQQSAKQIQTLTFNEQVRQMDLANEKIKQEENRKKNLQIAGVAIFLPLFFGLVLLLSRRQIRPQAIEFLGVLFLLFVFEFITLFAHPFVGKWTHESPIWMLFIFVVIAVGLVPLHHRSEIWIKKQLVLQRKKALQRMVRAGQEAQKKLES